MNVQLTCAELVERITDLLESAVDPPARQRLDEHLATCGGCHTYFEQLLAITRSLSRFPPEPTETPTREMRQILTETYRRRAGG